MMEFKWREEEEGVSIQFRSSPNMVEQFKGNMVWRDIMRMYEEVAKLAVRDLVTLDPIKDVVPIAQAQAALRLIEDFLKVPESILEEMTLQDEAEEDEEEEK